MFSVYCETHGTEVLLTTRNIRALRNTDAGVVVAWECRCGQQGAFLSGRPPRLPAVIVSEHPAEDATSQPTSTAA